MHETTQTQAIFAKPALLVDGVRHEIPIGLFRVGRDAQNHLVLEDASLSRTHFVIDVYAHQAQLIDVGSSNGTYVNKRRVHSAWLKDGDRIRIGDQVMLFQAPGFMAGPEEILAHKPTRNYELAWLPLLALLVASASLFMQLVNRERQMQQDHELKRMWASWSKPEPKSQPQQDLALAAVPAPREQPDKKWQKALLDFKAGSEDEACEKIKSLIPELSPKDLLRAKAKSFFERKCVL